MDSSYHTGEEMEEGELAIGFMNDFMPTWASSARGQPPQLCSYFGPSRPGNLARVDESYQSVDLSQNISQELEKYEHISFDQTPGREHGCSGLAPRLSCLNDVLCGDTTPSPRTPM